jgi:hypothetical protein
MTPEPRVQRNRFHQLLGCLLLGVLTTGCGDARSGSLSGRVTYQGKPVVFGVVQAFGSDGLPASCLIQPDGSYTLTGLPVGDVRIAVNSPNPAREDISAPTAAINPPPAIAKAKRSRPAAPLPPPADMKRWFPLPAEYADVSTSGIQTRVESRNQAWDIQLK